MRKFVGKMFGVGDDVSSKRVITFLALFFMLVGYVANLFFDFMVEKHMFESLQWIVMAGLGFVAAEKFSPNK